MSAYKRKDRKFMDKLSAIADSKTQLKRVPVYIEPCTFGNPNCTTTHYSNGDVECTMYQPQEGRTP